MPRSRRLRAVLRMLRPRDDDDGASERNAAIASTTTTATGGCSASSSSSAQPSGDAQQAKTSAADLELFRQQGFLHLGKIMSDAELSALRQSFDSDRSDYAERWVDNGIWQTMHVDALVTQPQLDTLAIRHPAVLPVVEMLFGEPACFSELELRHMEPYSAGQDVPGMTSWEEGGSVGRRWHRDGGSNHHYMHLDHPLKVGFLQLIVYLEDVDPSTHCFAISPQAADETFQVLSKEEQVRVVCASRAYLGK